MCYNLYVITFTLDLPNLRTLSLLGRGFILAGDNRDHRKAIINGHESFDNILIMKSKLKGVT